MPNWVTNRIVFHGDQENIDRVLQYIKGNGSKIDFNKIIPMPDNIYRGDLGKRERELYGSNNWYDWRIANWGTKWNAYWSSINNENSTIILWFDTAWSCPLEVLDRLAEICIENKVGFEGEWADEDCGTNIGEFWTVDECEPFAYHYIDSYSDEAYDIYTKLKGENYCLGKDEHGHWIKYSCDNCPNSDKC